MKLSELEIENYKVGEPATSIYSDEDVTKIVYDGIGDDNSYNEWCVVFGNSNQIDERAETIVQKYHEGRFKKIVLCGGTNGISNTDENSDSEALRIKKNIVCKGIPERVIYLDEKSNNTFENIDNALNIIKTIDSSVKSISIISGEYHLKRCLLALKFKYPNIKVTTIPSYDGYANRSNWFNGSNEWNTGRCIVLWERNLLSKYAKNGFIYDIEVNKIKLKYCQDLEKKNKL